MNVEVIGDSTHSVPNYTNSLPPCPDPEDLLTVEINSK